MNVDRNSTFTLHRRRLRQAQNRRKCPQLLLKVGRRRPGLEQDDALDILDRRKVQPLTTLAAGGRWIAFTQL